jgi:hypothetical protein
MTVAGEDLAELPRIGRDLAEKIEALASTGHIVVLDEIKQRTPAGLLALLDLQGLGPKRAAIERAARDPLPNIEPELREDHRNSVANGGFDKLAVGEVRFVAQLSQSTEAPQASIVVPLGKHHLPPTEAVRDNLEDWLDEADRSTCHRRRDHRDRPDPKWLRPSLGRPLTIRSAPNGISRAASSPSFTTSSKIWNPRPDKGR